MNDSYCQKGVNSHDSVLYFLYLKDYHITEIKRAASLTADYPCCLKNNQQKIKSEYNLKVISEIN